MVGTFFLCPRSAWNSFSDNYHAVFFATTYLNVALHKLYILIISLISYHQMSIEVVMESYPSPLLYSSLILFHLLMLIEISRCVVPPRAVLDCAALRSAVQLYQSITITKSQWDNGRSTLAH